MFRKKIINAYSNLKRGLHLRTKIKSHGCLDIGTGGVKKNWLSQNYFENE